MAFSVSSTFQHTELVADALSYPCRTPMCHGTMRLVALREHPYHSGRWQCSACGVVVSLNDDGMLVLDNPSLRDDLATPHCANCAAKLNLALSS